LFSNSTEGPAVRGKRAIPAVLFALATLAACEVGPDYESPSAEKQAVTVSSTDTADAESAGIVSARPVVRDWWLTLRDPKLTSLVDALVDANLDVKAAQARVREARAVRGATAGALYPQVTYNGDVGVASPNDKFHGAVSYNTGLGTGAPNTGVIWTLDVWGGLRRSVEVADANLEAAVETRRDTLLVALSELGTNYVALRGEQRQLEIARRNVELQEKTLGLEKTLQRSGLASDLQVSQAATQLESTRSVVPTLEAQVAKSIFAIGVLLGREPSALLSELSAPSPIPEVPPTIPVGLPSELLVRRPDIRKAERAMAAASAQIGVAETDLFPKFSLTGSLNYSSTYKTPGEPSFFAGPTVVWPIFSGFTVVNNIRAADARLEESTLAYRSAVLGAFEDVEDSLVVYAKELVRRDTLARASREAQKAADLAQTQYKNGLVDFLNVLTAQGTLASAQLALAASEQSLLVDLVALYKALGGGWDVYEERLAQQEQQPSNTDLPK
jgi:NodT family efflux transporter outer membrane factor (OMF) lipoprotein